MDKRPNEADPRAVSCRLARLQVTQVPPDFSSGNLLEKKTGSYRVSIVPVISQPRCLFFRFSNNSKCTLTLWCEINGAPMRIRRNAHCTNQSRSMLFAGNRCRKDNISVRLESRSSGRTIKSISWILKYSNGIPWYRTVVAKQWKFLEGE